MSETIDYFDDIIECPECGTENHVECISIQESGEIFNEVVAGQKCKECDAELKF